MEIFSRKGRTKVVATNTKLFLFLSSIILTFFLKKKANNLQHQVLEKWKKSRKKSNKKMKNTVKKINYNTTRAALQRQNEKLMNQ